MSLSIENFFATNDVSTLLKMSKMRVFTSEALEKLKVHIAERISRGFILVGEDEKLHNELSSMTNDDTQSGNAVNNNEPSSPPRPRIRVLQVGRGIGRKVMSLNNPPVVDDDDEEEGEEEEEEQDEEEEEEEEQAEEEGENILGDMDVENHDIPNLLSFFRDGVFSNNLYLLERVSTSISTRIIFAGASLDQEEEKLYDELLSVINSLRGTDGRHQPTAQETLAQIGLGEKRQLPEDYSSEDDENDNQEASFVELISRGEATYRHFNLRGRYLVFRFVDGAQRNMQPTEWLRHGVREVLDNLFQNVDGGDFVGISFNNEQYADKPIWVSFRRRNQLDENVVLDIISRVMQSNATFFSSDILRMQVDIITTPVGTGRNSRTRRLDYEEYRKQNRGILRVNNNDTYCLAYALVLGIELCRNKHSEDFVEVEMKNGGPLLFRKGEMLCNDAAVDLSGGARHEHLEKFQEFLSAYTITVYSSRDGRSTFFEGPKSPERLSLNLYFENGHYDVISSLTAAFAMSYFCEWCKVGYNDRTRHVKCPFICPCCHTAPACQGNATVSCRNCRRDFKNDTCFQQHKKYLCTRLVRCQSCLHSVWNVNKQKHTCNTVFCAICQKYQPRGHLCYMQPSKRKESKEKTTKNLYIFYDLESRQDECLSRPNTTEPSWPDRCSDDDSVNYHNQLIFRHVVNLCVAQHVCDVCMDSDLSTQPTCVRCGVRQHIFADNPVSSFLNYVADMSQSFNVIAIAHNSKGYDAIFVLKEMLKDIQRWTPNVIRNGTKLLAIKCGRTVHFIDSLNFMPMALSKLPSTFKFPGSKGYFPHFFNTAENENYVGPVPDQKYYGVDHMSSEERLKFISWHTTEISKNAIFDMQKELLEYCVQDVNILRTACVKFMKLFLSTNDINPFGEAITIASCCNLIFRRRFLQEGMIGIIPNGGYRLSDNQSLVALKWLYWVAHEQKLDIQHAGNGREVCIDRNVKVDGFCQANNTVYQFHGCYYHGCLKCYANQMMAVFDNGTRSDNRNNDSLHLKRERTLAIESRIKSLGYNLVVMWECDFDRELRGNEKLQRFVSDIVVDYNLQEPLDPRDAFYGGRTNATKLYYKCETEGEKIHYYDFCSLYPYINKYGSYPVGHPEVIVGNEACSRIPFTDIEGLVKCTVLPPSNLYHPVLPYRWNGKLTFPLCRTCLEQNNLDNCSHDVSKRVISGTWVSHELRKAVELGYKILRFDEIWQYQVTKYDSGKKEGGLFAGYINSFLKLKQENSGWPAWVKTPVDQSRYIENYFQKEGVLLEKDKICSNPGLRYIAKLNLNSFWGKLGERPNMMQTAILSDSNELFKMLHDKTKVVHAVTAINDNVVLVTWELVEEAVKVGRNTNVVLAAYTTALARLKLYSVLEVLDRRVLYFDTDSVIFTSIPGQWMPPTGDFLGEFTNELESFSPDAYIDTFVSGGPKNYAFHVSSSVNLTNDTVCKVKGITLNYRSSQKINFESLKRMVTENAPDVYVYNFRKIARTGECDIVSKPERKIYRVSYSKRRRLCQSYDTLPFGFIEN